ncbi:MAG: hypothetical protein K9W44_01770 [Candidatus Lokiarchaeota archaeon]|nr:hypothetical protein [Candidatus Harpocratesius repetitus]
MSESIALRYDTGKLTVIMRISYSSYYVEIPLLQSTELCVKMQDPRFKLR